MKNEKIIQAWKNEDYRHTLSATEQSALPNHPAGDIELKDAALDTVSGAVTFLILCASFDLDCDTTVFNGSCKLWSHGCCSVEMT